MYLDETILQSRTTLSLVRYIDELWEFVEFEVNDRDIEKFRYLSKKYDEIKTRSIKAKNKRSFD